MRVLATLVILLVSGPLLPGCSDSPSEPSTGPGCYEASSVGLVLSTSELPWGSAGSYWMIVGEQGSAFVTKETRSDNPFLKWCGTPGFAASNDAIDIGPPAGQFETRITARHASELDVSANYQGLRATAHLIISSAPLPVDELIVDIGPATSPQWLPLDHVSIGGQVEELTVASGSQVALRLQIFREGNRLSNGSPGLQIELSSDNTVVASFDRGCRPPEIDPSCGVYSDLWLTGWTAGTTRLSLVVRNLTRTIDVSVVEPGSPDV